MEFLKPRSLKARQRALEIILPCLRDVQDDLGNVPIDMQQDEHVNGTMIGVTEKACATIGVTRPDIVQRVIAEVFEEVYRREATEVLLSCDEQIKDPDSVLSQARTKTINLNEADSAKELGHYVEQHYERPNTLVL